MVVQGNLVKAFESTFKKHWDLPALSIYKGETLTYGDMAVLVEKIHIMFEQCGVKPGNKIALIGKSHPHWAVSYIATITYGCTIVPILVDFHPNDVQNLITHSDAVMLFCGDMVLPTLSAEKMPLLRAIINMTNFTVAFERDEYNVKAVMDNIDELFAKKYPNGFTANDVNYEAVDGEALAVISYTSGTTGFSKGVMLPHRSLMANIEYAIRNMQLDAGDRMLSILPLAHAYGCAFELLWPLCVGAHITFLGRTAGPSVLLEAFKVVKPHLLLLVPLLIEKIYKKQVLPKISSTGMKIAMHIPLLNQVIFKKIRESLAAAFGDCFREVVIGGAALNPEVEAFLHKIKFHYSVGYGMTECGPLVSYAGWRSARMGSCGKLVDALEMTIDSPDPEKQAGEIMVRGEGAMLGYYKNPAATEKTIDKDGWLHTGDLGVLDKDGFIHLKGRSKSMILGPSGENIYPEEIEAKLNALPYVQEQLVISEENKLVALVYPDVDLMKNKGLQMADLEEIMENNRRELNDNLPKFMQVSRIQLQTKEFEKTPKQSIKRFLYENQN